MKCTLVDTSFAKVNDRRTVASRVAMTFLRSAFQFSLVLIGLIVYVVWFVMQINSNSNATRMLRNECLNVSKQVSELEKIRQNRLAELEHLKDGHRITAAALRIGLRPADTTQTARRCDVVYRYEPPRMETIAQRQ